MFSKISVLCALLVTVNAGGFLNRVALHHVAPSEAVISTHYAVPLLKNYAAPVVVYHTGTAGYSRSYDSKYFGASKYAIAHGAPLSYSTLSEVNHAGHGAAIHSHVAPAVAYSSSTVVKHAAPVVVAHAVPHAVGHVSYNKGHGFLGHRHGGIVYNGHNSVYY